jgi:hypothetical protein
MCPKAITVLILTEMKDFGLDFCETSLGQERCNWLVNLQGTLAGPNVAPIRSVNLHGTIITFRGNESSNFM